MHLCWGNYEGPHHLDVPLGAIIGEVMKARPMAVSFEAANPRHEHEWTLFEDFDLPDDKVIIPGVLDSTTNYIEHPELVAQRLERYARLVGQERVIAGSDCGFATFAAYLTVDPRITWAKLAAMAEGARIATERLKRGLSRARGRATPPGPARPAAERPAAVDRGRPGTGLLGMVGCADDRSGPGLGPVGRGPWRTAGNRDPGGDDLGFIGVRRQLVGPAVAEKLGCPSSTGLARRGVQDGRSTLEGRLRS